MKWFRILCSKGSRSCGSRTGALVSGASGVDNEPQGRGVIPKLEALKEMAALEKIVVPPSKWPDDEKVDLGWVGEMVEKYAGRRIEVVGEE